MFMREFGIFLTASTPGSTVYETGQEIPRVSNRHPRNDRRTRYRQAEPLEKLMTINLQQFKDILLLAA